MISIAMATYNGARFIREQLDSILAQTITDWELVVCDDCSSDETVSILQEYITKDSRIQLHRNPQNLGFKRNFEQSISLCKGDYIALCDQDDIWYPTHLEILVNQIGNYSLSIGNSDIVDSNNNFLNKKMSDTDALYIIPEDSKKLLYRALLNSNPFQGAAMLLKKEFANKCLPIPNDIRFHDTWISACACALDGIIYSFNPIIRYRQHNKNVTIESERIKKHSVWQTYTNYIIKAFKTLVNKHHSSTDRFMIAEELHKRFGNFNEDFAQIALFLDHSKKHHLTYNDIKFLWRNIEYITTSKSKSEFLHFWFLWSHMNPII